MARPMMSRLMMARLSLVGIGAPVVLMKGSTIAYPLKD